MTCSSFSFIAAVLVLPPAFFMAFSTASIFLSVSNFFLTPSTFFFVVVVLLLINVAVSSAFLMASIFFSTVDVESACTFFKSAMVLFNSSTLFLASSFPSFFNFRHLFRLLFLRFCRSIRRLLLHCCCSCCTCTSTCFLHGFFHSFNLLECLQFLLNSFHF